MTSTPINRFRPFNIHLLVFLLVMVSLFFLFIDPLPSQATQSLQERPNKEAVLKKMAGICVPFVENRGQVGDERVRYYARTFGGSLFVTESGEMIYSLPYKEKSESNNRDASRRKGEQKGEAKNTPTKGVSLKETLVGATINLVQGEEMSSSKVSYFRGNDQSRWQKGLSTYETVSLGEVYPGIDLKLKAYGNNAEKLFTVRPSRDPNLIRMNIEGAKAISITTTGELEITTDLGPVRFTKPVAFQEIDGKRIDVPVQYALTEGTTTYGFTVASYDNTRDLAIDPLLQSTYLGGSKADLAYAITLDSAGNVYVAGETSWDSSYNRFPGTTGGARPSYGGGTYDVFVAKLNSSLTSLLQSTYLGGSDADEATSIALDSSGNVYVAGYTRSTDFPGTAGGAQATTPSPSGYHAFISKLNSALTAIIQSTYLGGGGDEDATAIVLDSTGNVYVAGHTSSFGILDSPLFPGTSGGAQATPAGGTYDAYVAKINPGLTSIIQSTYLGGTGYDYANAITLDSAGNVYVVGDTFSTNFPGTAGGAQFVHGGGGTDAFVAKFSPDLKTILQSTYLGGEGGEGAQAIALDTSGGVYVAGNTGSLNLPATAGGAQPSRGGSWDAYVAMLSPDLKTIIQSTYLGGSSSDSATSIALDSAGNVFVAGYTSSTNFPGTTGGAQATLGGGTEIDAFVARFSPDLKTILQSTYLGGGGWDLARSIAINSVGDIYITGETYSTNFPNTAGGVQPTAPLTLDQLPNKYNAFVAKFDSTLRGSSISVFKSGNGGGTIISSPEGINCGANCSKIYGAGLVVTLNAQPDTDSAFADWTGCTSTGPSTCSLTMTFSDAVVTATFNDVAAPTCSIQINGGAQATKTTSVTLTLSASDTGSGTSQMAFSDDGTTFSAWETYNTSKAWALPVTGSQKVWVKFKDTAGNESSPCSATIFYDDTKPIPAITSPANGTPVTSPQAIGGTASDVDPSSGLDRVELQVTDGAGKYLAADGTWTTTAAFFTAGGIPANWTHTVLSSPWTFGTTYTITARAFDKAGNFSDATSTFTVVPAQRYATDLKMELSSQAVRLTETIDVTGKLSSFTGSDPPVSLNDMDVVLTIRKLSDGSTLPPITIKTYDDLGYFEFRGVSFPASGGYELKISITDNLFLFGSQSIVQTVLVGTSAGYAILVQGKISSGEGLPEHNKTANSIYQKLRDRGFDDNVNIKYFNYNTSQTGVDGAPSFTDIRDAVTGWASTQINDSPAPLYIILVDHGTRDGNFHIYPDVIRPSDLADWLEELEKALVGAEARSQKIVVVIGSCYSGSFIPILKREGSNRIIVTSAAQEEQSYRGPVENDGIRNGEYFLEEFFSQLARGYSLKKSFQDATDKTRLYTRKDAAASNTSNPPYFDNAIQHPLLDDTGDGKGSNVLSDALGDGFNSRSFFFGIGPTYITNGPNNPADIATVTDTLYLSPATVGEKLWLKVTPGTTASSAWLEIRSPLMVLQGTGGETQLTTGFDRTLLWYNGTLKRWEKQNGGNFYFYDSGRYEVFYQVRDLSTGKVSTMHRSVVYRNTDENTPPGSFSLLSPEDNSAQKTVLVFRWEKATDADGDPVTYNLVIATDSGFSNVVYRREEIPSPMTALDSTIILKDGTVGLKDTTEYYWKVEAVDGFGAITVSTDSNGNPQIWHFHTDNTNGFPGIITGIVYSDQDFSRIAAAKITINIVGLPPLSAVTQQDGTFVTSAAPGIASLTSTPNGFNLASVSDVSIAAGVTTVVNIGISPVVYTRPGDVNRSGDVDIADAILALQFLSGMTPAGTVYKEACVNGDGKIGMAEVIYIMQQVAGVR